MSFSSLRNKITTTHTRVGQGRNTGKRAHQAFITSDNRHCPCPTMYGDMSFGSLILPVILRCLVFRFPKRMTVNSMSMTPYGIGCKNNAFLSKCNKKTQIFIFLLKNIRNNLVVSNKHLIFAMCFS